MSGKIKNSVYAKAKELTDKNQAAALVNHYLQGKVSTDKVAIAQDLIDSHIEKHGLLESALFITKIIMLARKD